jgi:hypothetical protein
VLASFHEGLRSPSILKMEQTCPYEKDEIGHRCDLKKWYPHLCPNNPKRCDELYGLPKMYQEVDFLFGRKEAQRLEDRT